MSNEKREFPMSNVMACIDGSPSAPAVCDYAAWASLRMGAPLTFLHMLDSARYPTRPDLSGTIGLGSREHLLQELATLDEQRARLALEDGKLMLAAAAERARAVGVAEPLLRQRHGELVDALRELENDIRLLVIGRQGEASGSLGLLVGSQLESVIRTVQRPILVCPGAFKAPENLLLAWDGSATAQRMVERLVASSLLTGLPCHLLLVGAATETTRSQLEEAAAHLQQAGFAVTTAIRAGEVEETLLAYQAEHAIDLLVMGAYGHSRMRQYLVGSTTSNLLRACPSALLILR